MELMAEKMRQLCQRVVTESGKSGCMQLTPEEVKRYADFLAKK